MSNYVHFKVDPRLTAILGESYRRSEEAIKELIDNAWDAEATEVHVTLPGILSSDPIMISDNGAGMKPVEVENEYLNIANPRWTRKGEKTPNRQRTVKGRRGIGKFAGLTLAAEMELETKAHGKCTNLRIAKNDMLKAGQDLERIPLPLSSDDCDPKDHGTVISLRSLNQNLLFPQSERLREILAYDYGKETDFAVFVNGDRVFRHDIAGRSFTKEVTLPNGKVAVVNWTIADKPVPSSKAGLMLRAGEKAMGRSHLFGLEHNETLSDRLRRRVVGEIAVAADAFELTAAGGDVIECDKNFEYLTSVIQDVVTNSLAETHSTEFNLAKGRWAQKVKRRLETVPEHRRPIIRERLEKLISRAYQEGEKEERIDVLIELVLDALEMDEYWTVCREINEAEKVDVFHFANALEKFGLCDLAFMGIQAKRRLEFLDWIDRLACDEKTTEAQMHKALQNNLWVFGNEYSLMASNQQLQTIIQQFVQQEYTDKDAADRPDLLLAGNVLRQNLLVEFKRPCLKVGRQAENQAIQYADSLTGRLGMSLEILVVGGEVDPKLCDEYTGKRTKFLSYHAVIASARTQLEWLLRQLQEPPRIEKQISRNETLVDNAAVTSAEDK